MQLHSVILGESSQHNDLIIMHGLYGSSSNWRSLGNQYATTRRVHLIDLRNHGRSPWYNEHNYLAMSDDIAHYVLSHDLMKYDLLGHSMGGKVAMANALMNPQHVGKLIVADISPIHYVDNEHELLIAAMKQTLTHHPQNRNEADSAMSHYIQNPALRQFFLQNLVIDSSTDGVTKARWRLNLDILESHLPQILGFPLNQLPNEPFNAPALFIHGARSDYVLPQHHKDIYHLFPSAQITTIDNASHWLHVQKPDEFLHITQQFLEFGSVEG